MKNTFALATLIALTAISSSAPVWCADAVADAAQMKLQSMAIPNLQQAVAGVAVYEVKNIEIKTTAHQVTVTVINSKFNTGTAGDREADASKIVAAIENSISAKAEFAQVAAIHVDYVKRPANGAKPIQGFDFYKSPAGTFVPHKT